MVYDGIGKTTFPASLDCIRPLGMFASFGSASGQIEAFNINILQTKGSLFATRPTLNTYVAKREDLLAIAKRPVRRGRQRQGQDPDQPEVQAQGRREGAPGPRRPQHHGLDHPGAVTRHEAVIAGEIGEHPMAGHLARRACILHSGAACTGRQCRTVAGMTVWAGSMGRLTTHVLDTSSGRPGAGVRIVLRRGGDVLADVRTNADGRTDKPLLEGAAFRRAPMS